MTDLFGNEAPEPVKPEIEPVAVSLFDHAAEWKAIASGRPVSQERSELMHGNVDPDLGA